MQVAPHCNSRRWRRNREIPAFAGMGEGLEWGSGGVRKQGRKQKNNQKNHPHSREGGNLPVIWCGAGNARAAPLRLGKYIFLAGAGEMWLNGDSLAADGWTAAERGGKSDNKLLCHCWKNIFLPKRKKNLQKGIFFAKMCFNGKSAATTRMPRQGNSCGNAPIFY